MHSPRKMFHRIYHKSASRGLNQLAQKTQKLWFGNCYFVLGLIDYKWSLGFKTNNLTQKKHKNNEEVWRCPSCCGLGVCRRITIHAL